jgi:hypothetical protein
MVIQPGAHENYAKKQYYQPRHPVEWTSINGVAYLDETPRHAVFTSGQKWNRVARATEVTNKQTPCGALSSPPKNLASTQFLLHTIFLGIADLRYSGIWDVIYFGHLVVESRAQDLRLGEATLFCDWSHTDDCGYLG